jgi:hypothetical protein
MIVSLLGPPEMRNHPPCAAWYLNILNLMREHNVRRVWAPCAGSGQLPGDSFHPLSALLTLFARAVFPELYTTARSIENVFQEHGEGLEWTVFRVGRLQGNGNETSWKRDRGQEMYAGGVGSKEWKTVTSRAGLARWLVDCFESGQDEWICKMPAVSDLKT